VAQSSIGLPTDGQGKKVPTGTFTWGTEGTVHAQGIFLCDSSGNIVGVTGTGLNVQVANFPATQPVSGTVNVGNLPATQPVSGTVAVSALPGSPAQEHATAASPLSARLSDGASYLGSTAGRLNVSDGGVAFKTDGSATTQPVSGTVAVSNLPATQAVSGTVQVGNFPASQTVRDQVDVGRSNVVLGFDSVVGIGTEALQQISGVKANTAVTAANTYTVTAGKTLRVTAFRAVVMAGGTTVVNAKVRLRANYTATATATSPVYAEVRPGIISATAIANQVGPDEILVFPDGLEFPAGASVAMSHVMTGTVTSTQVSAQLIGFEY
jgi:hypothetical protein